jgi:O-antigen/teichoic acid export membrane protein
MVFFNPSIPRETASWLTAGLQRARRLAASAQLLGVLDQIVVSGASFAATLLLGRTNSAALGEYSLAISVVAMMLAAQNALVLLPFAIRVNGGDVDARAHAGDALALSAVWSLLAAVLCLAVAGSAAVLHASGPVAAIALTLGLILPFVALREFARRFALARLRMDAVLMLDIGAALIQIGGLAALEGLHALSGMTAAATLGLSCAVSAIAAAFVARNDFIVSVRHVWQAAERSWTLGKWLLLGQLASQVQSYGAYWLSSIIAGAAVTGVYAACMSIIGFANPVVFGVGNVLTPKLAQAWRHGAGPGIRREARKNAFLLGALVAAFCLVVAVVGEDVMEMLLPGHEYQDHGAVLIVLAFALLAMALGMPASNALASMERPRAIVVVGSLSAAVTVVLVTLLMTEWGLIGAAYGYLAGNAIGTAGRWFAFLIISRSAHEPAPPLHVLQRLAGTQGEATRLGGGDYAAVFAVRPAGGEPVVTKIYHASADASMAQAEFDALAPLSAALDGRTFAGWTMRVPRPLTLSHAPLALAMSAVPGRKFEDCQFEDSAHVQEAGKAFAAALQALWSAGLKHGDLGLRNLLFDLETRTIALVDPGTAASCPACHCGRQSAAALDLAHLVAELTTDVNDLVSGSSARAHKQVFVTAVLRHALQNDGADRAGLLEEMQAGVTAHLAGTLATAVTPRGLWNRLVRSIAERRLADLIGGLQRESASPQSQAA